MTRNKKHWIWITLIVLFVLLGIIFTVCFFMANGKSVKSSKAGDISRNEWIKMLCEQVGMTEYRDSEPYFNDVDEKNAYFAYIQSAVEWDVLDAASDFDGESLVSGKDIALTAMKTLGERKIQIYLNSTEEITEETYLELAIENGLMEEDQFTKGFTKEESEQVLEKLEALYFGTFWKDDYSYVKYQEGVTELLRKDVLQSDADCLNIMVTKDAAASLETGTIIVFEQNSTKCKIAREITNIAPSGELSLKPAELSDTVEALAVSDITEITFEDIANYYGFEENVGETNNLDYQISDNNVIPVKNFSFGEKSEGFKISLSTEGENNEQHLEVNVTNNATNISYKLPVSIPVKADNAYRAELNIDKMYIGGQVVYSLKKLVEYADVALDVHATLKGELNLLDEEKKIPLFKTPVPLGGGAVGVDVEIYLVVSVEGNISLEADLPFQSSVYYEKGKGVRKGKHDVSVEKPTIEADCKADTMVRIEPILILFGMRVLDMEADMGASAEAKAITRPNAQTCMDISAFFPVIKLSACGDDEAETIVGKLGLSGEWEIISSSNAPYHLKMHYEILPNKKSQFVEHCTYKKKEEEPKDEPSEETQMPSEEPLLEKEKNTYRTRYAEIHGTNSPQFYFDYSDNWKVVREDVDGDPMFGETVVLENDRGVTVTYMKFETELGYESRTMTEYKAEKAAEVMWKPFDAGHSGTGNFVVAKVKAVGTLDMDIDTDFTEIDGETFYAVLQESELDYYGGVLESVGLLGYYDTFSFDYPTPYALIAESPNGQFTEDEEKEIIEILTSFREME